jgi:DNA-binding CsgD family transcriptional regulator
MDEAIAAFRAAACGFIPMSLDPSLALHAFTFLMSGGSYFPPTFLNNLPEFNYENSLAADRAATEVSLYVGGLTRKQQQVLDLLRKGRPNKVIARALSMQEATVKVHVRQILRKLGVSNRTEAALMCATENGLVDLGRHMDETALETAYSDPQDMEASREASHADPQYWTQRPGSRAAGWPGRTRRSRQSSLDRAS